MSRARAVVSALAWRAGCSDDGRKLARWARSICGGSLPFVDCLPPGPAPTPEHWHVAQRQVEALATLGLQVALGWQLPEGLARLQVLPLLLFVRGDAALLRQQDAVAIVGARRASPGPARWARARGAALAARGTLVVSGGAVGIDAAAHAGALDVGAPTLAYMGTPIDRIYPAANATLFRQMLACGGALVSEHPPLAATYKSGHAARNRFIAAHGRRLVVVEAGLKSGTLSAVGKARSCGTPIDCAPLGLGGDTQGMRYILAQGWANEACA